jgi:hypothetical protein
MDSINDLQKRLDVITEATRELFGEVTDALVSKDETIASLQGALDAANIHAEPSSSSSP